MFRSVLRRLAIFPFALILVHFIGFAYAHLVRPMRAERNPFLASQIPTEPLFEAYTSYLGGLFRGEFGMIGSPWGGKDTISLGKALLEAVRGSLGLMGIALLLSVVIGLLIGRRAAHSDPPRVARWMAGLSTVGLAMPSFFIGSLFFAGWFLYALYAGDRVMPLPLTGFGWDSHLIVPTIVLMARPTVQIAHITAGFLVEEYGKQYVVAARSRGNSWNKIRSQHVLRNIIAPVILTIASSIRWLVGELIVVEYLFDWQGLGNFLAQTLIPPAAYTRSVDEGLIFLNPPVVAGILVAITALFLLTDLIASILARLFDPRLRED